MSDAHSYPRESVYNDVLRGEIPIWINADGNGYKMRWVDGGPVEVVIPREGTVSMPLVMGMAAGAPRRVQAADRRHDLPKVWPRGRGRVPQGMGLPGQWLRALGTWPGIPCERTVGPSGCCGPRLVPRFLAQRIGT